MAAATQGGGASSAIYNNANLTSFRTARSNAGSSPCDILFVDDSNGEGFNAGYGTRYQDLLIKRFRTTAAVSGVTEIGGSNYIPAFYSVSPNAWTGTQPYNAALDTGTINAGASAFAGKSANFASVGASRTWEFKVLPSSVAVQCDKIEMLYPAWTTTYGQFKIQIDGGTTENTDQFTITSTGSGAVTKWTSPSLTPGAHTIKVTALTLGASTLSVVVLGFNLYNGDSAKGMRSIDCCRQSWKVADFNSNQAFKGLNQFPNVKLIVFGLTTNDYRAQTALATYESGILTALSTIRTAIGNATCPVLFMPKTEPGDVASQPIPWNSVSDRVSYVGRQKDICDVAGNYCSQLDLGALGLETAAKSPTTPIDSNGTWTTDRLHLTNPTGHARVDTLAGPQIAT